MSAAMLGGDIRDLAKAVREHGKIQGLAALMRDPDVLPETRHEAYRELRRLLGI